MILVKPPHLVPIENESYPSIFLAGSIEMGKAEDWQTTIQNMLLGFNVVIYNPRRDDWDASWIQSVNNEKFVEQVSWELEHINKCDFVFMYFDPSNKSPISLLELGILTANPEKVLVCCPEGFWRKGNVDVVCQRYGIQMINTKDEFLRAIEHIIKTLP
jgi:hypothetical protein